MTDPVPSGAPETAVWHCPYYGELIIECFNDEYILFNSLSGETHVLSREAKFILDLISERPSSPARIADRLAREMPEASGSDREIIGKHLGFLEQWGLAVRDRFIRAR